MSYLKMKMVGYLDLTANHTTNLMKGKYKGGIIKMELRFPVTIFLRLLFVKHAILTGYPAYGYGKTQPG